MPVIWMDVDTALSEVPVNAMALIDDTDFKTREESVVFNQAGLDLVWNFVTPAGEFTQTAVTPTSAGVYDWTNQGNGMYSIEIPASGGASINNDTEGFGWFTGFATGILPWRGPTIGFRAAGLNDALIESAHSATRGLSGTALPDAAAESAGGLFTRGTGAGQINQDANGRIDVNVAAEDDIDFGTTKKNSINAQVDIAFDTAIPGVPTANSINERIAALDDLLQAGGGGDAAAIKTAVEITLDAVVDSNAADLATLLGRLTAGRATNLDNLDAPISGLNDISPAEVNAEIVDVMTVDTIAELTTGVPAATPTVFTALMLLYMKVRNETTATATQLSIKNNAGAVITKATLSDAASTFTKAKLVSGP